MAVSIAAVLISSIGAQASSFESQAGQVRKPDNICNTQSINTIETVKETQTANLLSKVKTDLTQIDAGVDYDETKAVIFTENKEEVQKAARDMNGRVESYDMGVGVIKLNEPILQVLEDKKEVIEKENYTVLPQLYYKPDTISASSVSDDKYGQQYYHDKIKDAYMWEAGYTGKGVKVCVIDSGISTTSEAFKNTVSYIDFTGTGIEDRTSHGTDVAGVIAAPADGEGIVGVAPEAELYIAKVADLSHSYPASNIYRAYRWAIDNDVDIVNMSYGSPFQGYEYPTEKGFMEEMYRNGIVPVTSAGNDSTSHPATPAIYKPVITVAACKQDDNLTDFSNYNSPGDGIYDKWIDVCVPGENILTTGTGDSYHAVRGTSLAAPIVTGILALLHETPAVRCTGDVSEYDDMKSALKSVTTDKYYASNSANGYGVQGGIDLSLSPYATEAVSCFDILNESVDKEDSPQNKQDKTIQIEVNGVSISYKATKEYAKKRLKPDVTIQYNNEVYTAENIRGKYKHCKNTGLAEFVIKSVPGNKELSKRIKGTILRFNITPRKISSNDIVNVKKTEGTSAIPGVPSAVYIRLNGKRTKIPYIMYGYSENTDKTIKIKFSGNYTGEYDWNPNTYFYG